MSRSGRWTAERVALTTLAVTVIGVLVALSAWLLPQLGSKDELQTSTTSQPRPATTSPPAVQAPASVPSVTQDGAESASPPKDQYQWVSIFGEEGTDSEASFVVDDDQTDNDSTVELAGKRYPRSIAFTQWAGKNGGSVNLNLGKRCKTFRMTIGMEDKARELATADFKIRVDGADVWNRAFQFGDSAEVVNINVPDGLRLTLAGVYDMDGYGSGGPAAGTPEVLCMPSG